MPHGGAKRKARSLAENPYAFEDGEPLDFRSLPHDLIQPILSLAYPASLTLPEVSPSCLLAFLRDAHLSLHDDTNVSRLLWLHRHRRGELESALQSARVTMSAFGPSVPEHLEVLRSLAPAVASLVVRDRVTADLVQTLVALPALERLKFTVHKDHARAVLGQLGSMRALTQLHLNFGGSGRAGVFQSRRWCGAHIPPPACATDGRELLTTPPASAPLQGSGARARYARPPLLRHAATGPHPRRQQVVRTGHIFPVGGPDPANPSRPVRLP